MDRENPVLPITNFDKTRYFCRDFAEREWASVWAKSWLFAGLIQDLPQPGCFFTFDVGPESVLVTRDQDGEVRAFYNVCQHRGNKLVTSDYGEESRFTCSYHAWSYGIDGALKSAPQPQRFPNGLPCERLSLKPVRVATWSAFVFVNFDPEAEPLEEFLGAVPAEAEGYHFEEMLITEDLSVRHRCNWKAFIDNFSELYHVDFIHPQHRMFVNCAEPRTSLYPRGHTAVWLDGGTVDPHFPVPDEPNEVLVGQLEAIGLNPADFRGRVLDIRRAIQEQKRVIADERGFDFSALSDDQLSDIAQYNLFPNTIISFTPEACWIMRARPHAYDPEQSYFDKFAINLFPKKGEASEGLHADEGADGHRTRHFRPASGRPKNYERPRRECFDHEAIIRGEKSMDVTIDQDIHLLADVQDGMRSSGFECVWLSEEEVRVQHFHNRLDELMR